MVEYVCIRVGQAKCSEMEYTFFGIGIISTWKTMSYPGKKHKSNVNARVEKEF